MLPDIAIFEFQAIYRNELGLELSMQEAKKKGENFIRLFDLVTSRNEYEKSQPLLRAKTNY